MGFEISQEAAEFHYPLTQYSQLYNERLFFSLKTSILHDHFFVSCSAFFIGKASKIHVFSTNGPSRRKTQFFLQKVRII